jgi:hypothetical protein
VGEPLQQVKRVTLLGVVETDGVIIRQDRYFPNAYLIDLQLDLVPDHVWQDMFEREWRTSMHLWDRKLFIIGDTLRLVTTPEGMEEKLGWIKEIIDATNRKVENFNKKAEFDFKDRPESRKVAAAQEEAIEKIKIALRKAFQM